VERQCNLDDGTVLDLTSINIPECFGATCTQDDIDIFDEAYEDQQELESASQGQDCTFNVVYPETTPTSPTLAPVLSTNPPIQVTPAPVLSTNPPIQVTPAPVLLTDPPIETPSPTVWACSDLSSSLSDCIGLNINDVPVRTILDDCLECLGSYWSVGGDFSTETCAETSQKHCQSLDGCNSRCGNCKDELNELVTCFVYDAKQCEVNCDSLQTTPSNPTDTPVSPRTSPPETTNGDSTGSVASDETEPSSGGSSDVIGDSLSNLSEDSGSKGAAKAGIAFGVVLGLGGFILL